MVTMSAEMRPSVYPVAGAGGSVISVASLPGRREHECPSQVNSMSEGPLVDPKQSGEVPSAHMLPGLALTDSVPHTAMRPQVLGLGKNAFPFTQARTFVSCHLQGGERILARMRCPGGLLQRPSAGRSCPRAGLRSRRVRTYRAIGSAPGKPSRCDPVHWRRCLPC